MSNHQSPLLTRLVTTGHTLQISRVYPCHINVSDLPPLPQLDNMLPVLVLQLSIRCQSSHSSLHHVFHSPGLSVPSGLGRTVLRVIILLLSLSGDIESNPGPVGQLTPNDLSEVRGALYEARAKWYDIGVELKLSPGTLASIRKDYHGVAEYLREVCSEWLKCIDPPPTWEALAEALERPPVGERRLAQQLRDKYCRAVATSQGKDSHEMVEGILGMVIEEKLEECLRTIQREETFTFTNEETHYLELVKDSGDIQKHVTYCQVLPRENALKLLGTPEGIQRSYDAARKILESRKVVSVELPVYISDSIRDHFIQCQSENPGVLVTLHQDESRRFLNFTATERRMCKQAAEWTKVKAYPYTLDFTKQPYGGRSHYLHISSTWNGYPNNPSTSVEMRKMDDKFREAYLQTSEQEKSHYRVELHTCWRSQVQPAASLWYTRYIHDKLEILFKELQPLQGLLKLSYEARFGQTYWKLTQSQVVGKLWTLRAFKPPTHILSRFLAVVAPGIENVLSQCSLLEGPKIFIDPLKLYIITQDGICDCVAAVKEIDNEFLLQNVFLDQRAKGIPQFNIMLPEKNYDVRIAPTFLPAVVQYRDRKYEIAHKAVKSLRRSGCTLFMNKKGADYCVKFVRCKKQTLYRWKETNWVLAVYEDVMETEEEPREECQKWLIQQEKLPVQQEKQPIQFKKAKTEIELLHTRSLSEYSPEAFSDEKEWNTKDMLEDFEQFLKTSLGIVDLLKPFPKD